MIIARQRIAMLRISIIESPNWVSFILEGSLIAPWLAELQKAWSRAQSKLGGRKALIDIRSVTHISQLGEDALLRMMIEGAKINCNGVFNRRVVQELRRRCKANSKNVPWSCPVDHIPKGKVAGCPPSVPLSPPSQGPGVPLLPEQLFPSSAHRAVKA